MTEAERLPDAVSQVRRAVGAFDAQPELLPTLLSEVCVEALRVDAAGISLVAGDFRLPLGSSGPGAAMAEALQFTSGEGPCLGAARVGEIAAVQMPEIYRRWPMFAAELDSKTPYRAIVSLPLQLEPGATGAIDLYLEDPLSLARVGLADAVAVAAEVAAVLRADAALTKWTSPDSAVPAPAWLHAPATKARGHVWIAIGILMQCTGEPAPDLLARMRGYAYAEGLTLDAVAEALADGSLPAASIMAT
jgi:hypothetical protein